MMRYVFGILGVIVVAVAAIVLIFTGDPGNNGEPEGKKQLDIVQFVDSPVTAVFTIEGEINGTDEHDSVQISVSQNERRIEHLSGYNGTVVNSQTFPNTREAYDHFLHALKNAGFSNEQEADYESHKGVCPFGNRYIYELKDGAERVMRLWSTSCDDDDGNFAGEEGEVRRLFQLQIPRYREFARDIEL